MVYLNNQQREELKRLTKNKSSDNIRKITREYEAAISQRETNKIDREAEKSMAEKAQREAAYDALERQREKEIAAPTPAYKPIPTGSSTFEAAQIKNRLKADAIMAAKGNQKAEARGVGIMEEYYEGDSQTQFSALKSGGEVQLKRREDNLVDKEYNRLTQKYGELPWSQEMYREKMTQREVEYMSPKSYEMYPSYDGPRPSKGDPFGLEAVMKADPGYMERNKAGSVKYPATFGFKGDVKYQEAFNIGYTGYMKTPFGGGMGGELTPSGGIEKASDMLSARLQAKAKRESYLPEPTVVKTSSTYKYKDVEYGSIEEAQKERNKDVKIYEQEVKAYDIASKKQLSDIIRASQEPGTTWTRDDSGKVIITQSIIQEEKKPQTKKVEADKVFQDINNSNQLFSPIDYGIIGTASLLTSTGKGGLRAISALKELGPHAVGLAAFYVAEKIGQKGAGLYFDTVDKVIDYSSVGPSYKEGAKELARAGLLYLPIKGVQYAGEKLLIAKGFSQETAKEAAYRVFEVPMKPGQSIEQLQKEGTGLVGGLYAGGIGYGATKYVMGGLEKGVGITKASISKAKTIKPPKQPPMFAYPNLGESARSTSSISFSEKALANTGTPKNILQPATVKVKGPELFYDTKTVMPTQSRDMFNLGKKGQAYVNVNIPATKVKQAITQIGEAAPSILKQQNIAPGAYIFGDIFANINRPGVALKYKPKYKEKEAAIQSSVYENRFEYMMKNLNLNINQNINKDAYKTKIREGNINKNFNVYKTSFDLRNTYPEPVKDIFETKETYKEPYVDKYDYLNVNKVRTGDESRKPKDPKGSLGLGGFIFDFSGGYGSSRTRRTKSWQYQNPFLTGKQALKRLLT